jgi:hypothetical protein
MVLLSLGGEQENGTGSLLALVFCPLCPRAGSAAGRRGRGGQRVSWGWRIRFVHEVVHARHTT